MSLAPGAAVRVEMSKHGGRPHWRYDAVVLHEDDEGAWLGVRAGTRHERPGFAFDSEVDKVVRVTREHRVAALLDAGLWCDVYVDMATPPVWDLSGEVPVLRSVDLDLDVIRRSDGRVFVDDEDEFAEHRETLGYPEELVRAAETSRDLVLGQVRLGQPPFDTATVAHWLGELRALGEPPA
ncbi:MAG TPA: DUF402 domain-containing protein [Nocardioides sp.]